MNRKGEIIAIANELEDVADQKVAIMVRSKDLIARMKALSPVEDEEVEAAIGKERMDQIEELLEDL